MGIDANNQTVQLPRTLSALQRLAVQDVQKCQADSRYVLHMLEWHVGAPGEPFLVCMAGAVMAQTCGVPHEADLAPADLDEGVWDALEAIDHMRTGGFSLASALLLDDVFSDEQHRVMEICDDKVTASLIEDKGHAPWHVYLECADMLEEVGL